MRVILFLLAPVLLFLHVSSSNGIPIYPDDQHDDWMLSKRLDDKPANLASNNKPMNLSLNGSDTTKNAGINLHDQIINRVDKEIDKKLNSTDFSKKEINELKLFAHKGIQSKSIENLTTSNDVIIRNTEILIEKYKDQRKTCMADQILAKAQASGYKLEACLNSFKESFCPHFPFC